MGNHMQVTRGTTDHDGPRIAMNVAESHVQSAATRAELVISYEQMQDIREQAIIEDMCEDNEADVERGVGVRAFQKRKARAKPKDKAAFKAANVGKGKEEKKEEKKKGKDPAQTAAQYALKREKEYDSDRQKKYQNGLQELRERVLSQYNPDDRKFSSRLIFQGARDLARQIDDPTQEYMILKYLEETIVDTDKTPGLHALIQRAQWSVTKNPFEEGLNYGETPAEVAVEYGKYLDMDKKDLQAFFHDHLTSPRPSPKAHYDEIYDSTGHDMTKTTMLINGLLSAYGAISRDSFHAREESLDYADPIKNAALLGVVIELRSTKNVYNANDAAAKSIFVPAFNSCAQAERKSNAGWEASPRISAQLGQG